MKYERNVVLGDLRKNVIEFFMYKSKDSKDMFSFRATLRDDILPKKYQEEKLLEQEFHEQHQNLISSFNIINGQWVTVDISDIKYLQIVDGY